MSWRNKFWWLPFGGVPEISAADLNAKLSSGAAPQLVDVRSRREWNSSHIAGSVNSPITVFRSDMASLKLDPSLPVVAICLSAHRSIPAVRVLRDAGFGDVCQLQGGMRAWWEAGLPTVK